MRWGALCGTTVGQYHELAQTVWINADHASSRASKDYETVDGGGGGGGGSRKLDVSTTVRQVAHLVARQMDRRRAWREEEIGWLAGWLVHSLVVLRRSLSLSPHCTFVTQNTSKQTLFSFN